MLPSLALNAGCGALAPSPPPSFPHPPFPLARCGVGLVSVGAHTTKEWRGARRHRTTGHTDRVRVCSLVASRVPPILVTAIPFGYVNTVTPNDLNKGVRRRVSLMDAGPVIRSYPAR